MKIRACLGLAILSFNCVPTATANVQAFTTAFKELTKAQLTLAGTIAALYGWYLKRKPVPTRCCFDDLVQGKNWRHIVPDFIPGHPKVAGKVVLKNDEGEAVEFVYKEDVEGAGPFYWIESNLKNIAKVSTVVTILLGLLIAHNSADGIPGTIQWALAYILGNSTKMRLG